jgi:hypothetical protein
MSTSMMVQPAVFNTSSFSKTMGAERVCAQVYFLLIESKNSWVVDCCIPPNFLKVKFFATEGAEINFPHGLYFCTCAVMARSI